MFVVGCTSCRHLLSLTRVSDFANTNDAITGHNPRLSCRTRSNRCSIPRELQSARNTFASRQHSVWCVDRNLWWLGKRASENLVSFGEMLLITQNFLIDVPLWDHQAPGVLYKTFRIRGSTKKDNTPGRPRSPGTGAKSILLLTPGTSLDPSLGRWGWATTSFDRRSKTRLTCRQLFKTRIQPQMCTSFSNLLSAHQKRQLVACVL